MRNCENMKKYQIIYADPPWSYNDKMAGHGGAESEYTTQDIDWICGLPVQTISDTDCVLFLWAVSPLLPEAFRVIAEWGFRYKTVAFCWNKTNPVSDKWVKNMGRWTMGNIEWCLLATKGRPQRITKNIFQLIVEPRLRHSRKPPIVRSRIIDLMGELPRIEMFARKPDLLFDAEGYEGWDVWGNEVESDIEL